MSNIKERVAELNEEINALRHSIDGLEESLGPVLVPPSADQDEPTKEAADPNGSVVGDDLYQLRRAVENQSERIRDLIGELDLPDK